ncbi:THO complex 6 homolog (Drosophila) [Seminavis robusta]|uniref:THO complex 6 homolog (Drosophila) n=1 Tax=Seminavis robusta TaxID=568900 RepID=A0A9N8ED34_9STRA|nr:THO complex 6 homolog (Drosophila) [Seminavis robusta]|eukprot:Sro946_g223310.1 THO complex 6 homolog (Drosophila) (395) ;mRNA; r:32975-34159
MVWPTTVELETVSLGSFTPYSVLRTTLRPQSGRQQYEKHVIVFGLCWIDVQLLAACTSHGEIVIWSLDDTATNNTKPVFRRQVSKGKLYSIQFCEKKSPGEKSLLIVCGDEGVLLYDWEQDIYNKINNPTENKKPLTPLTTFCPHPSPLENAKVEVNDFQVLKNNGSNHHLLGAAGDSFGVYKWDMESGKLVANYASPERKSIYAVQMLPSSSDNSQILLAGGEGGKVQLWDTTKDQSVGAIDTSVDATKSTTSLSRSSSKRAKLSSRWISSICASDPNWFTVAGGNTAHKSGHTGFLATYHAPTRSLVSSTETRETPQQIAASSQSLVCVANEGIVSRYNALSLEQPTGRQWCTSPSSYAAAVSSDHTAVAGVGCFVDVFDSLGEKCQRLEIC